MGLFSRKTIITVSSQQILLGEPAGNLDKEAILTSVLSGTPIAQGLMQARLHGMYSLAEKYYVYGKAIYTNGLPEGSQSRTIINDLHLLPSLRLAHPDLTGIRIVEANMDVANPTSFVYLLLRSEYQYDPETGLIGNPPEGMGDDTTILAGVTSAGIDLITLSFLDTGSQTSVEVVVSVPGFIPDKVYIHVLFTSNESDDVLTWEYEVGSGLYSRLDNVPIYDDVSPYYPIVPIRVDNVDLTSDDKKSTPLYKTSKHLLKKLTIDIHNIGDSINSNENVAAIDHVFFGVKVDIRDDTPIVTDYLARYFYSLYQVNPRSEDDYNNWSLTSERRPPPYTTIVIQDDMYRSSLNYTYITTSVEQGKLDDPEVTFNIEERGETRVGLGRTLYTTEHEKSGVTYRYQEKYNVIRTVNVFGLMSIDYVYGKHTIDINLKDSADDTTKMMIPIHRGVIRNMHLPDRNKLFHSAMYLTINTYDKRREKWYETTLFQIIMVVIAIVIIIVSAGSATPAVAAFIAAYGMAVYVILSLILNMVIGKLLVYVVQGIVSVFGLEWAQWIVAILVVYTIYSGGDASNMLAELSNGLVSALGEVSADIIAELGDDIAALLAESQAFSEEMDALIKDILGDVLNVDVSAVLREAHRVTPIYLAQESAADYYARIEGSRHLNEMSLAIPSIYHEKMLTPQTLDELLNEFKKDKVG